MDQQARSRIGPISPPEGAETEQEAQIRAYKILEEEQGRNMGEKEKEKAGGVSCGAVSPAAEERSRRRRGGGDFSGNPEIGAPPWPFGQKLIWEREGKNNYVDGTKWPATPIL